MKGMRVQSIIRELRGEKIDIIEYSDDPVVFATHALSPAKISRVSIVDAVDRHMEVIVDDTQLSLAIGKKGQNVRLAAKLLGWKIDIKSEEEKRQEVESQMAALVAPGAPVSVLLDYGLPEHIVEKLFAGGVPTVERLGGMTPEELEAIPGIGPDWWSRFATSWSATTASTMMRRKCLRMPKLRNSCRPLEMGEEGYNYSESSEDAEDQLRPLAEDKPSCD